MRCLTSLEQTDKVSALEKDCLGVMDGKICGDLIKVVLGM